MKRILRFFGFKKKPLTHLEQILAEQQKEYSKHQHELLDFYIIKCLLILSEQIRVLIECEKRYYKYNVYRKLQPNVCQ